MNYLWTCVLRRMYVKLFWEIKDSLSFLRPCFPGLQRKHLLPHSHSIQYQAHGKNVTSVPPCGILHFACCLTPRKAFLTFMAIIHFCATLGGKGASFHNPFVGSRQSLWVPSLSIQPCWADCLWLTCQRWRKTHCRVLTTAQPLPIAGLISVFFRTPKLWDCHPEIYRSLRSVRPENVVQLHTLAVIMRCLEMGEQ